MTRYLCRNCGAVYGYFEDNCDCRDRGLSLVEIHGHGDLEQEMSGFRSLMTDAQVETEEWVNSLLVEVDALCDIHCTSWKDTEV